LPSFKSDANIKHINILTSLKWKNFRNYSNSFLLYVLIYCISLIMIRIQIFFIRYDINKVMYYDKS